jgi:hypothetical protein
MAESRSDRHQNSFVAAAAVISIALIICAFVVRAAIIKVKSFGNTITVTGAASKPIKSDFAIWDAEIAVNTQTMEAGYARLKQDIDYLTAFLAQNGFEENQYDIQGVRVYRQYDRDGREIGIRLLQHVRLELDDVDRIQKLSRDASTLLEKGVELSSQNPQYLFTGLDKLKLEMIRAATENAKNRAKILAETTGKEVGAPISAGVGVFQIRPLHSQEVSAYGISDTYSIDKEIVCTVHISFMIE